MPQPQPTAGVPSGDVKPDAHDGVNALFLALAVVALVVGISTFVWGLVVLTFAALALVPLMFLFFIAIAWPFPAR